MEFLDSLMKYIDTIKDTVTYHYQYEKVSLITDFIILVIVLKILGWVCREVIPILRYSFIHFFRWMKYADRRNDYLFEVSDYFWGLSTKTCLEISRDCNRMLSILKKMGLKEVPVGHVFKDKDHQRLWISRFNDLVLAGFVRLEGDSFKVSYKGKYKMYTVKEMYEWEKERIRRGFGRSHD